MADRYTDKVEELVQQQVLAAEAAINGNAFAQRVISQVNPIRPVRNRTRIVRWSITITSFTAASILFAFFLLFPGTSIVSAEQLIDQVRVQHSKAINRCYEIETVLHSGLAQRFPWMQPKKPGKLWTYNNAFVMQTEGWVQQSFWGRDAEDRVWFALGKKRGLLFDPNEVDQNVTLLADLFTMRLDATLEDLPKYFQLTREVSPENPNRILITATPRFIRPANRFRKAILEIDSETKLVHSLKLERLIRGEHVATVLYTLVESAEFPTDRYTLDYYLDADAKILGPDQHFIRDAIFKKYQEMKKG